MPCRYDTAVYRFYVRWKAREVSVYQGKHMSIDTIAYIFTGDPSLLRVRHPALHLNTRHHDVTLR